MDDQTFSAEEPMVLDPTVPPGFWDMLAEQMSHFRGMAKAYATYFRLTLNDMRLDDSLILRDSDRAGLRLVVIEEQREEMARMRGEIEHLLKCC